MRDQFKVMRDQFKAMRDQFKAMRNQPNGMRYNIVKEKENLSRYNNNPLKG